MNQKVNKENIALWLVSLPPHPAVTKPDAAHFEEISCGHPEESGFWLGDRVITLTLTSIWGALQLSAPDFLEIFRTA